MKYGIRQSSEKQENQIAPQQVASSQQAIVVWAVIRAPSKWHAMSNSGTGKLVILQKLTARLQTTLLDFYTTKDKRAFYPRQQSDTLSIRSSEINKHQLDAASRKTQNNRHNRTDRCPIRHKRENLDQLPPTSRSDQSDQSDQPDRTNPSN